MRRKRYTKMKNYSILAKYYDRFSQNDCDYIGWSQYLCQIAKKYDVRSIADIACGTGKMTKLLCEKGFAALGVDSSAEMLSIASQKCRATFVLQDMKKLSLPKRYDMAVAVNDGINYLSPPQLLPFFENLAANLKKGAPLVFDISSPYKFYNILDGNVFFVDDSDATLLWTNAVRDGRAEMDLTLFEARSDGLYTRKDEKHIQYVHTRESIETALAQSGFDLNEVTAEYGKKAEETSLRLTFFATAAK